MSEVSEFAVLASIALFCATVLLVVIVFVGLMVKMISQTWSLTNKEEDNDERW